MIKKVGNRYYLSDGVGVFYGIESSDSINKTLHTHEFIEFVYMLKGKCTHVIGGKEYVTNHGDMLIINYNQTHEIRGDSDTSYINILINPGYINQGGNSTDDFSSMNISGINALERILDENKRCIRFSFNERIRIEEIIAAINRELNEKNIGYENAVYFQINYLILLILRKITKTDGEILSANGEELLEYIKKHCHEKLKISEIAEMCSYNVYYFSRKFKEYTGITFREYIKNVRMEKAVSLLLNTGLKVSEIAERSGYNDRTKFHQHFYEYTGVTPLKYRNVKK